MAGGTAIECKLRNVLHKYIMRYEGMSMAGSIVLGNFRAGHKITLLDVQ